MSKRILIVEDECLIAEDLKMTLQQFGYEANSIVAYGEEVLSVAREIKPDLALIDIKLRGGMDGLSAAQNLYNELGTPVIFLTANANIDTIKKAVKSAPYGYLIKPFQERELQVTIELALYKHKMNRFLRDREILLRNVIDIDPNMIYVKDREGHFAIVNRSFADMFGLSPEEIVGKTLQDLADQGKLSVSLMERLLQEEIQVMSKAARIHVPEEVFDIGDGKLWLKRTVIPLELDVLDSGLLGVWVEISDLKNTELQLEESYRQLQKVMEQTVNGFGAAMEMRDPFTAGHQRRVSVLAVILAKNLGLDAQRIEAVRLAALLHDIGKIYIPSEILNKPQHLLNQEYDLVKLHPEVGYNTLKKIDFSMPIADIVLQHHEKLDGSGYPKGLTGDEILFEAKIISVADYVEAMVSNRPYREARSLTDVIEKLKKLRGISYDADVVDAFIDLAETRRFDFNLFTEITSE